MHLGLSRKKLQWDRFAFGLSGWDLGWIVVHMEWTWESYNRLMAISRTTLYHIHDSTLKASMAWSPLIGVWRFGVVLRVGVHFTGTLGAKLRLGFLRRLWRCWRLAACFQKDVGRWSRSRGLSLSKRRECTGKALNGAVWG